MRITIVCLAVSLALSSCGKAPEVDAARLERARAAVAASDPEAARLPFLAVWAGRGDRQAPLVCGRIAASNPLMVHEKGRRFVYDDAAGSVRIEHATAPAPAASPADGSFEPAWERGCAAGER